MKSTWLICGIIFICTNINSISSSFHDVNSTFWFEDVLEKIKEKKQYIQLLTGQTIKDDFLPCLACDVLVTAILVEKGFDMTAIQLTAEAEYFCEILEIQDSTVCEGVIGPNVDPLYYIMENANVSSPQVCSMLMDCDQGKYFEWTIDIPEDTGAEKTPSDGTDVFKIGHITDIHYDPNYTEGKVLKCREPLCCQSDQADAKDGEAACGYWSSSEKADSSYRLVESAVEEMTNYDLSYVYFTGDLVAHRVWGTSHEFNTKLITDIMDLFADKFKVPVFPILGNHESHPVNVYAPLTVTDEDIAIQWLYDLIVEKWTKFFDESTAASIKETISKGGYYTVKVRDGFRVIVLNNNVASNENWWNLYQNEDPYGQLKWLAKTLEKAEADKEIVHILYHIHTSSCMYSWSREYNKLINRFKNTVAAQFNGHTHRDEFFVHYNNESKPFGVTLNGGSLMPDLAAPNFKIYSIDSKGYDVIDSETYTFDLEVANKNKKIDWTKLYSFRESFGVTKLTPDQLDSLVDKLNTNDTLLQMYHNYHYRNSKTGQVNCDENCKKNLLCKMVTTQRGVQTECDRITKKIKTP